MNIHGVISITHSNVSVVMSVNVAFSRKKSSSSSAPSEVVETGGRSEKMGLLGAISYIVGNIVGSGIFITPTAILGYVNSVGLLSLFHPFTHIPFHVYFLFVLTEASQHSVCCSPPQSL